MNIEIRNEDCFEGMKTFPDKHFDLTVTDPPYNVDYDEWDNIENYDEYCQYWFKEAMRVSKALVFTPGMENVWRYPQADWIICWAKPASARRNRSGGFNHWEPVLVYGMLENDIRIWKDYIVLPPSANRAPEWMTHPCPKPVNLYFWLVEIFTEPNGKVFDPFSGSGTAAVACIKHNDRDFLGYENNKIYFEEAQKRIEIEQRQIRLL